MSKEKEIPIKDTIFEPYETIVFDLDGTIWLCTSPTGEQIGAYMTVPPYHLRSENIVTDLKNNTITLQKGIRSLLDMLDASGVNLGIASAGEVKDRPFESQPSILLLNKFDIRKYFNYDVILKAGMNKAEYVKDKGSTLFVDDIKDNTDAVNSLGRVDVLWRGSFRSWEDLLPAEESYVESSLKLSSWEEIPDEEKEELQRPRGYWYKQEYRGSVGYYNYRGQRHNTKGPAITYFNGYKEYWVNDEQLSKKEFNEKYVRNRQASIETGMRFQLTKDTSLLRSVGLIDAMVGSISEVESTTSTDIQLFTPKFGAFFIPKSDYDRFLEEIEQ